MSFFKRHKSTPVILPEPVQTLPELYGKPEETDQPGVTILSPVQPLSQKDVLELQRRLEAIDRNGK